MVPLGATLFGQLSLSACAEWLWSGYAVKHPDLKIIMSEGGIGWVAMLHDRLENIVDRSGYGHYFPGDLRPGRNPAPQLLVLDDRRPVDALARATTVGVDHITFESDYPHGDGTWPDTQAVFGEVFGGLPARRDREDLPRERGRAVPPPAAAARQPARGRHPRPGRGRRYLSAAYRGAHVQLDLPVLAAGASATFSPPVGEESVLVLLAGSVDWNETPAQRTDVFASPASAVYLPPGATVDVGRGSAPSSRSRRRSDARCCRATTRPISSPRSESS